MWPSKFSKVDVMLFKCCLYFKMGDPERLHNLPKVLQLVSSENSPPKSTISLSLLLCGKEDRMKSLEWCLSVQYTEVLKGE